MYENNLSDQKKTVKNNILRILGFLFPLFSSGVSGFGKDGWGKPRIISFI